MKDEEKQRAIESLTDFERAALVRKNGWPIVPTEIFGTQPHLIPEMWSKGLIEVYWAPMAIVLRQHMLREIKETHDDYGS